MLGGDRVKPFVYTTEIRFVYVARLTTPRRKRREKNHPQ
jgi:hypothetical protein